jgi:hypothetical protein
MKKLLASGALPLLVFLLVVGCSEDNPNGITNPDDDLPPLTTTNTCLGCHSSEDNLKAAVGSGGSAMVLAVNSGDG